MENVKFEFDREGLAWDYTPTLISPDFEDRGAYYCIHDNKRDSSRSRYIVSIFPTIEAEEPEDLVAPLEFRTFDDVVKFFRLIGLTVDLGSLSVKLFLGDVKPVSVRATSR